MVAKVLLNKKKRVSQNRQMWKGKVPPTGDEGRGVYILDILPSFLLFNIEQRVIHPDDCSASSSLAGSIQLRGSYRGALVRYVGNDVFTPLLGF